jgi:hypothetical protein
MSGVIYLPQKAKSYHHLGLRKMAPLLDWSDGRTPSITILAPKKFPFQQEAGRI